MVPRHSPHPERSVLVRWAIAIASVLGAATMIFAAIMALIHAAETARGMLTAQTDRRVDSLREEVVKRYTKAEMDSILEARFKQAAAMGAAKGISR